MTPKPKSAAIVPLTGPLAVRGKNPKLSGAAGSSRWRGGRRDGERKQAWRSRCDLEAGDKKRGRSSHDPAAGNRNPAQDENDENKEESDDNGNHLSPPSSPDASITI